MPYFEWDHNGRCKHVELVKVPCKYTGGSHKTRTDEYDIMYYCPGGCRGTMEITVPRYTHVPEFDAPRPPADFVLKEHAERIIDNIYFGGSPS